MTAFLYLVTIRDYVYEHLAALTGARVTYTYGRIGGLSHDLPEGWLKRLGEILDEMDTFADRVHGLVDRNRIFIDRMRNVGVLKTDGSDQLGLHRPDPALHRRAARPAQGHARTSPTANSNSRCPSASRATTTTATTCACARSTSRAHMIRQLMDMLEPGPICVDDRRCTLPPKDLVYTEIESLINHFKLIMDGPQVPAGRGLLGAGRAPTASSASTSSASAAACPGRSTVRSPSFVHMGGVHRMLDGYQLADIVPTFGSVNMIGGECDR